MDFEDGKKEKRLPAVPGLESDVVIRSEIR